MESSCHLPVPHFGDSKHLMRHIPMLWPSKSSATSSADIAAKLDNLHGILLTSEWCDRTV